MSAPTTTSGDIVRAVLRRPAPAELSAGITLGQLRAALAGGKLEAFRDARGVIVIRPIEEGDAHRAQVAREREDRRRRRIANVERVRNEVAQLRADANRCGRDLDCVLNRGHTGKCVHEVEGSAVKVLYGGGPFEPEDAVSVPAPYESEE